MLSEALPRFYGSFLELELDSVPVVQDSVWASWTAQGKATTFATARQALRWIVRGLGCARVWLPSYICGEVPAALSGTACAIRYYAVDARLEPSSSALHGVSPGDAFVVVHYFGRPPSSEWMHSLCQRQGVTVIEDCAHALRPAAHSSAQWRIFSPRKLLGVPDGGLAVHLGGPCPPPPAQPLPSAAELMQRSTPALLGLEDPRRRLGQYAAYQYSETLLKTCTTDMMRLSRILLQRIRIDDVVRRRMHNWDVLHDILADFALWPDHELDFAPLVYPVQTEDPKTVVRLLAERGIFCARHWVELPSSTSFTESHAVARHLLSVPCDQRLTPQDMHHVGTELRSLLTQIHFET